MYEHLGIKSTFLKVLLEYLKKMMVAVVVEVMVMVMVVVVVIVVTMVVCDCDETLTTFVVSTR